LLDEAGVHLFEEARDRGDDRGTNFEESLSDGVNGFDVGKSGALKEVDVVERAAINVGERKKRERDVLRWIEAEVVADVRDVGAKITMRQHDALRLPGGAGSVDERSELAGENLGSAQTVRRDVRCAGAGDQGFVTKTFRGNVRAAVGDDNLFQLRQADADGEKFVQLGRADNENDLGATMFEDVGHAVGRFVEVHGNGDSASAVDGEVSGMPLWTVGRKKTDAVAGLHAEFHKGSGKASDAAENLLGCEGVPAAVTASHLGVRVRMRVDGVQEA